MRNSKDTKFPLETVVTGKEQLENLFGRKLTVAEYEQIVKGEEKRKHYTKQLGAEKILSWDEILIRLKQQGEGDGSEYRYAVGIYESLRQIFNELPAPKTKKSK